MRRMLAHSAPDMNLRQREIYHLGTPWTDEYGPREVSGRLHRFALQRLEAAMLTLLGLYWLTADRRSNSYSYQMIPFSRASLHSARRGIASCNQLSLQTSRRTVRITRRESARNVFEVFVNGYSNIFLQCLSWFNL
ncbi:hypothetical protein J6590_061560 [Homalodisca vitripennis]|nr:hypothetical protein J6590_061560 [Homalodisca vitripennis]